VEAAAAEEMLHKEMRGRLTHSMGVEDLREAKAPLEQMDW
jgi:hypothetical protein